MITYRSEKGSKLTSNEVDSNFSYLESILGGEGNAIVINNGFTKVGEVFTGLANSVWKINGNQYNNPANVVINIPLAATGLNRWERIVLNASNTFERVPGAEISGNPAVPPVPLNTIEYTLYLVNDNSVGEPAPVITGSQFVKKTYTSPYNYNGSGSNVIIPLNANGFQEVRLTNASLVSISGVDIAAIIAGAEGVYNGKPYRFRNLTGNNVTLKHNDIANATNPLFLNNEVDLVFPDNSTIEFVYDSSGMIEIFKSWVTTTMVQTARPLKTVLGVSIEGSGDVPLKIVPISGNTILSNALHKHAILLIKTNCTLTLNAGLDLDFNCSIRTYLGVTATVAFSGTTNSASSDGTTLNAKKVGSIIADGTNNFILIGEYV